MKLNMAMILVLLLGTTCIAVVIGNPMGEKVIGASDFHTVDANLINIPFKLRDVAEAVGMMSMGCTGTHIGNGLVISAGHCFDAAKIAKYRTSCPDIQVYWGDRAGRAPSLVSSCTQVLVLEDSKQRDYALFRVDVAPRAAVRVQLQGRPSLGARVTIFSHPFKGPLLWSGICEISRALTYGINNSMLQHNCDTNPGSSGAAIVDVNSLVVVGIHDGGVSRGLMGSNYGTYIDFTYIPAVLQRLGYR